MVPIDDRLLATIIDSHTLKEYRVIAGSAVIVRPP
jgi:hypothetical protein